jgi:hypothetical protein
MKRTLGLQISTGKSSRIHEYFGNSELDTDCIRSHSSPWLDPMQELPGEAETQTAQPVIFDNMSSGTAVSITMGKHEYVENLADVFAAAFNGDALERAAVLYQNSAPNDAVISREQWVKHWTQNIKKKIEAGGQVVEAGNWAAAALW